MTVRVAGAHEAEELLRVTNAAYQVEKFFIDTDRLDPERLSELLLKGVFLVTDDMAGCVYVELRGERAYFGPLSVDPARQGSRNGQVTGQGGGRLRARPRLPPYGPAHCQSARGVARVLSQARLCGNGDGAIPGDRAYEVTVPSDLHE